jgi:hypothetical protein
MRLIGLVVLTGWLFAGAAFTQATVSVTSAALRPGDEGAVIVQGRAPAAESVSDTAFVECVSKNLAKALPRPLAVYLTKAFQDAMFPWFEPGHAPGTGEELQVLLARPEVSRRPRNHTGVSPPDSGPYRKDGGKTAGGSLDELRGAACG